MNDVDRVMLQYKCDYCKSLPGEVCVVPSTGRRSSQLHASRFVKATAAGALPLREW